MIFKNPILVTWPATNLLILRKWCRFEKWPILTASAFLVHSADWLKQTTTFVEFNLFQGQRFQNHLAKNLEKWKDWLYMVTSLLNITRFTIISKSKFFQNSSFIMRARRLQEAFTRSILPFWNQENASSSQRWKTLANLFNDCSSLSLPETPS